MINLSPPIRVLAFDVYRTIIDTSSIGNVFSGIGLKVLNVKSFIDICQSKQLQYAWMLMMTNTYRSFEELSVQALKYTAKINNLTLTESQIKAIQEKQKRLHPFPDVRNGLEKIKSLLTTNNVKAIILTNGGKKQTEELLDNAGIKRYFEDVVSAETIKRFKPSPESYREAARRTNAKVSDVLLVSSNLWDAYGAQETGMRTCWLNREGYGIINEEMNGRVNPTFSVSSMSNIAGLLDGGQAAD